MRRMGSATLVAAAVILVASPVQAVSMASISVVNGDFETGTLLGFTESGVRGGFAKIVEEGTCFSFYDTTGITLDGSFAAIVRSSARAPVDSVGILTSDPFIAGPFVSFEALSETLIGIENPVTFKVRILAAKGGVLSKRRVRTQIIQMPGDPCGSAPLNEGWSEHFIDTSMFLGRSIRIQFRQHTNVAGSGYFTLVDNVTTNSRLFAELSGEAEVPGPGDPDGSGAAKVSINIRKQRVCFTVSVVGVSLPATAMHIHKGAAGFAGDIVINLKNPPVEVGQTGIGRADGCVADQPTKLLTAIMSYPEGFYLNVHTADFPGGAVRGQLEAWHSRTLASTS